MLCDVYIVVVMLYKVVYNGVRYEVRWYVVSVDISTVSRVRFSRECFLKVERVTTFLRWGGSVTTSRCMV